MRVDEVWLTGYYRARSEKKVLARVHRRVGDQTARASVALLSSTVILIWPGLKGPFPFKNNFHGQKISKNTIVKSLKIFNFKIVFPRKICVGQSHFTKFSFYRKFSCLEMGLKSQSIKREFIIIIGWGWQCNLDNSSYMYWSNLPYCDAFSTKHNGMRVKKISRSAIHQNLARTLILTVILTVQKHLWLEACFPRVIFESCFKYSRIEMATNRGML
jgi:hypothetical protein